MPLRGTDCGEPDAESVNTSDAEREPVAPGVKLTDTVQLAPAPTLLPQLLLVMAKSDAFAPLTVMPEIESAALPEFESVTLWLALADPTA